LEQSTVLQEQIDIATLHNNKQKQLHTMVNNDSSECISTKVTGAFEKQTENIPIIKKINYQLLANYQKI
jgi:hypothetical protein